ncbi:AI-2E family transporter [Pseudogracilibacillus sp. ICA-222130]|uniref:AI-2E family transporter n=1 Tax=Pseudogracilibacillus sp. ICA-222130 TaxID=3134655 RepID=UPI0030C6282D
MFERYIRPVSFMIALYIFLMIPFIQTLVMALLYLLLPFLIAYIFAYLLRPIQKKMEKFPWHDGINIAMLILGLFLMLLLLGYFFYRTIYAESLFLHPSQFYRNWQALAMPLYETLPVKMQESLLHTLSVPLENISTFSVTLLTYATKITEYIIYCTIIPFIMFFMMKDGAKWKQWMLDKGSIEKRSKFNALLQKMEQTIGQYVKGQLYVTAILTAILWVVYYWMDLPFAFVLALMMGVLNIIPFIGAIFGTVVVMFAASFIAPMYIFYVVILHVLVQLIENSFITPFILGKTVQLHPMIVLIAMIIAAHVAGFIGVIWSIPIVLCIKVILTDRKNIKRIEKTIN